LTANIPAFWLFLICWKRHNGYFSLTVLMSTRWTVRGIESRWEGEIFPHPAKQVPRPTQPPVQWVPVLFAGGTAAGACRWPPTHI
jgi:hypothetical protein